MIIKIEHFGHDFVNSNCAKLLVTGRFHHYVYLIT